MKVICFIMAFLMLLSGCSDRQAVTEPVDGGESGLVTIQDDLGRQVSLKKPERVAALIGSFADVWCLAGGKESLAAAANDAWTSFDLGLDESVANLGAIKEPNLEVLLQAEPDLILASCNTEANVSLLEVFEQAEIPVLYFDIQDFSDYLRMLEACTRLTGQLERYEQYGEGIKAQVETAIARQDGPAPKVLCLRATGSSCKAKGSADNVLGEMLADLGCINIADSGGGLLENLSLEAIIAMDPDYIFAVLQGADSTRAQETLEKTLLSHPAWGELRAVQEGRFYTLDHALYNLKPNARWGEAYEGLAEILYPQEEAS